VASDINHCARFVPHGYTHRISIFFAVQNNVFARFETVVEFDIWSIAAGSETLILGLCRQSKSKAAANISGFGVKRVWSRLLLNEVIRASSRVSNIVHLVLAEKIKASGRHSTRRADWRYHQFKLYRCMCVPGL